MYNYWFYLVDGWQTELEALRRIPIYAILLSHPFLDRLIETIHREYFDQLLLWNSRDLQHKLDRFRDSFNEHRVHASIDDNLPSMREANTESMFTPPKTTPGSHIATDSSICPALPD